jgi:hypothetical protein
MWKKLREVLIGVWRESFPNLRPPNPGQFNRWIYSHGGDVDRISRGIRNAGIANAKRETPYGLGAAVKVASADMNRQRTLSERKEAA